MGNTSVGNKAVWKTEKSIGNVPLPGGKPILESVWAWGEGYKKQYER